jgi:hypothetical protein
MFKWSEQAPVKFYPANHFQEGCLLFEEEDFITNGVNAKLLVVESDGSLTAVKTKEKIEDSGQRYTFVARPFVEFKKPTIKYK